jgi:hypothetical protein
VATIKNILCTVFNHCQGGNGQKQKKENNDVGIVPNRKPTTINILKGLEQEDKK